MTANWQRLADAIVARRAELGLTQMQVATRGDFSLDRVQALEGAKRTSYRAGTLAALERALDWAPGSVERILQGGDPSPRGIELIRKVPQESLQRLIDQVPAEELRKLVMASLRDRESEADLDSAIDIDEHLRRVLELWPRLQPVHRRAIVGTLEAMLGEVPETERKPERGDERRAM